MSAEKFYLVAKFTGYNQFDDVVYSVEMPLDDYYEEEHLWDSAERVKQLAMVKMVGSLYGDDGRVYQRFESAFSPDTGDRTGGWIEHDDGTTHRDGAYADDP